MTHATTMRKRSRRRGFTLVEMMVALTAGSLAITSIYIVSAASSQHFQEQQQISQTQASLRMAEGRLRADIERAGFLAPLNSLHPQELTANCESITGGAFGDFGAFQVVKQAADANLTLNASNAFTHADQLDMVGNYSSSDEYRGEMVSATSLKIQINNQAFRRSFGESTDPTIFGDALCAVFASQRGIGITDQNGNISVQSIKSCTPATQIVEFEPGVAKKVGAGHESCASVGLYVYVTPLSHIRYSVRDFADGATEKFHGTDLLSGINGPTLMRSEIPWRFNSVYDQPETAADDDRLLVLKDASNAVIGRSQQAVLPYVADFNVDIMYDARGTGAAAPSIQKRVSGVPFNEAMNPASILPNGPQRIRSALVRLSVRAPTEDPRFPFVARTSDTERLLRYELDTAMTGAARVRTVQTEIMLPNFAYKGR